MRASTSLICIPAVPFRRGLPLSLNRVSGSVHLVLIVKASTIPDPSFPSLYTYCVPYEGLPPCLLGLYVFLYSWKRKQRWEGSELEIVAGRSLFWEYEKHGLTRHIMFFMYHFHLFGWPPGTQAKCIQTIYTGTNFCFHRSKEKTRPLLTWRLLSTRESLGPFPPWSRQKDPGACTTGWWRVSSDRWALHPSVLDFMILSSNSTPRDQNVSGYIPKQVLHKNPFSCP